MDQRIPQRNETGQANEQRIPDRVNRFIDNLIYQYHNSGVEMNKQWIRKAIPENHRGKLEKWAKEHNFMEVNGDINLRKAMGFAKRHDEKTREKEITLARTLKKMRRK